MNEFLGEALKALDVCAPDTFVYSWHSLRHMAASSQSAIGVVDSKIMYLQNWSSMKVALKAQKEKVHAQKQTLGKHTRVTSTW